jgi:hypothetical protein
MSMLKFSVYLAVPFAIARILNPAIDSFLHRQAVLVLRTWLYCTDTLQDLPCARTEAFF